MDHITWVSSTMPKFRKKLMIQFQEGQTLFCGTRQAKHGK